MNVGQLVRTQFGLQNTFNIGFSTFRGSVTAAKNWDEAAQYAKVRNGIYGSYEHTFHAAADYMEHKDYYLLFRSNNQEEQVSADLVKTLEQQRYERYIGVIYRPDTEKASHYCRSSITKEFDAVVFIDETSALPPLDHTAPWEAEREQLRAIVDRDAFPELEPGAVIENDLYDWRLQAAIQINNIGCEFMKSYTNTARVKFEKALKYIEYNLKAFQANRELQDARTQILMNSAEANLLLKHWNAVIRDCNSILAVKPHLTEAHLFLGRAYEGKGENRESKMHFNIAAKEAAQQPTHLGRLIETRK